MLERRAAFKELRQKLFLKVRKDPSLAPFLTKEANSSNAAYRKAFKEASSNIIKKDADIQKVVAKARFGFDPVWSLLSQ